MALALAALLALGAGAAGAPALADHGDPLCDLTAPSGMPPTTC